MKFLSDCPIKILISHKPCSSVKQRLSFWTRHFFLRATFRNICLLDCFPFCGQVCTFYGRGMRRRLQQYQQAVTRWVGGMLLFTLQNKPISLSLSHKGQFNQVLKRPSQGQISIRTVPIEHSGVEPLEWIWSDMYSTYEKPYRQ